MKSVVFTALPGLPEIKAGDDLTQIIAAAVEGEGLVPAPFDVIAVAASGSGCVRRPPAFRTW